MSVNCYKTPLNGNIVTSNGIWEGGNPLQFSLPLLSVQLLLVVAVTRILHFLLKPLKQPRIVSEIMGGIILGPSVLCRNKTFKNTIFPSRGQPVLDTIATFGLMFVIFVIGVKMDPALVVRSGRKSLVLGLSGLVLPFAIATPVCMRAVPSLIEDADHRFVFTFLISTAFSMSSFAVLVPILSELNLLNSELGRIAMSASMTNDLIGWVVMFIYIVVDAGRVSAAAPVSAFFSVSALFVFIIFVVRPIAIWVVDHTPPGKPVDEVYIFVFLLIVLVVGFYSDIIGTNSFHGALVLGLVIPDGPPLGAALVEKIEAIVEGVLLPLYYALTGLNTDFSTLGDAGGLGKLQLVVFFACMGKLVGILLPSLYFSIPFQDALSLSLFMNTKGIVEVVTYHMWRVNKVLVTFALLVFVTVIHLDHRLCINCLSSRNYFLVNLGAMSNCVTATLSMFETIGQLPGKDCVNACITLLLPSLPSSRQHHCHSHHLLYIYDHHRPLQIPPPSPLLFATIITNYVIIILFVI